MSTKEQLLSQIDDLVASHTFGLDALEGIKKIKDSLDAVTVERDTLRGRYDELLKTNRDQSALLNQQRLEIEGLNSRIAAMQKSAEDGKKAVYEAEKHKAVADTWQAAMNMVFKPNAVRETVQRQVAKPVDGHPGGNGYSPTSGYLATGNESETVTREDA
jgi:chromosome segregation ATPase